VKRDWTPNYDIAVDDAEAVADLDLGEGLAPAEVAAILTLYNLVQRAALRAYFPVDPATLEDCEGWVPEYTCLHSQEWLDTALALWRRTRGRH
jgi:hypothetical protein